MGLHGLKIRLGKTQIGLGGTPIGIRGFQMGLLPISIFGRILKRQLEKGKMMVKALDR